MNQQVLWGNLILALFVLFVLYKVIYLAVKHALNDSKALRELSEEIRAIRSSGPPAGPHIGPHSGPSSGTPSGPSVTDGQGG